MLYDPPAADASDLTGMVSDGDDGAELETGDEPPDPDMFVTYADNVNAIVEEQPDEAEPTVEVDANSGGN